MKNKFLVLLLIAGLMPVMGSAQLRLPAVISSGMVLQQKDSATFWGWAAPGEKVFVTPDWTNRTDSTMSSSLATWKLKLETPPAGGPYSIQIRSGKNSITLKDVLIGEVWVCSGQSNMEWSYNNGTSDIKPEFATAFNKNIRFFQVPKTGADYPQDDVKASWAVCDSNTIKSFSSVGYFFGKRLQQELNVPIGLINVSWGGTPAETWTPESLVEHDQVLKAAASKLKPADWWPVLPGKTFNGMIYPLTDFNIAGVIWYQGESNTGTHASYRQLFTTMIDAWRNAWQKEFPFYYVQIAPYDYGQNYNGALLQEEQTKSMVHPKTGMVVITDLVDSVKNIHPSRKKPVGNRLANWALAETYGKTGIVYKSPELLSAIRENDKMILKFSNAGSGLVINGNSSSGCFVSGEIETWYPAKIKIENDQIIVTCPQVKKPYHVRYGFGNTVIGNVSNKEGLPIIPFRTDDWLAETIEK
jgi:sialate O-acetylesterase